MLKKLCQPHIAGKVLDDFSDPKTALSKIYPVCQGMQCEDCRLPCNQKAVEDFYRKLIEMELASGLTTQNLAKLFHE